MRPGCEPETPTQAVPCRGNPTPSGVGGGQNIGYRDEQPVLDACEAAGIAFLPWYPIAAGDLDDVADPLDAVAARHDATRHQIALAWLLQMSPVTVPIPGTSDLDHLADNVAAAGIELTDDERRRLDEAA